MHLLKAAEDGVYDDDFDTGLARIHHDSASLVEREKPITGKIGRDKIGPVVKHQKRKRNEIVEVDHVQQTKRFRAFDIANKEDLVKYCGEHIAVGFYMSCGSLLRYDHQGINPKMLNFYMLLKFGGKGCGLSEKCCNF
jgi:hypothetical protein